MACLELQFLFPKQNLERDKMITSINLLYTDKNENAK